jgi:hypothetical protein
VSSAATRSAGGRIFFAQTKQLKSVNCVCRVSFLGGNRTGTGVAVVCRIGRFRSFSRTASLWVETSSGALGKDASCRFVRPCGFRRASLLRWVRFQSQNFRTSDDIAVLENLRLDKSRRKIVFMKKLHNPRGGFFRLHAIDRHAIAE